MTIVFGEYHGPVYKNPKPGDPQFPFENYILLPRAIKPNPGMALVAVPMELSGIVQSRLAQKSLEAGRTSSGSSLALSSKQPMVTVAVPVLPKIGQVVQSMQVSASKNAMSQTASCSSLVSSQPSLAPINEQKYSVVQSPDHSSLTKRRKGKSASVTFSD